MTDILYELSLDINTQDFNKCFIKRNCKSLTKISPDEYSDYSYIDQGLLFIFRNSKYKKKVKVIASLYGIRLNKDFIKNTTEHICTSKQIEDIIIQSNSLFKKIYFSIVPPGNYYKKRKAIDIINHEIDDVRLRRKMINLVTLISEKKSLLLAQKTMNTRGMCKIMNAFKIIGLSPITISKREKAQYLKNIY